MDLEIDSRKSRRRRLNEFLKAGSPSLLVPNLQALAMSIDEAETSCMYLLEGPQRSPTSKAIRDTDQSYNLAAVYGKSNPLNTRQSAGLPKWASTVYGIPRRIAEPVPRQALDVFLAGTVIPAPSGSSLNGHFSGLVALVESSSSAEALPIALEAVALASLANRIGSADLHIEATRRYTISIRRLRTTGLSSQSNALNVIACIVLLSTYELVKADSSHNLNWLQHLHGLFAVIRKFVDAHHLPSAGVTSIVLGSWPFPKCNTRSESSTCQTSNNVLQPEIPHFRNLCAILPKVQSLFKRSATMLEPDSTRYESALRQYRDEAIALRSELLAWSSTQPEMTRPKTLVHFTQPYVLRFPATEDFVCPVTRADTYPNYFLACMWSSYRQCQLHLTDLLNRINQALSENPEAYRQSRKYSKLCNDVLTLIDDTCASIPFLLIGESIHGNKPDGPYWRQNRPPMFVGGSGLQWIFFTISVLEIVPATLRQQMKISLMWIGKNLGIGQATVMAHMEKNPPGGLTARGDALRWTGFLI